MRVVRGTEAWDGLVTMLVWCAVEDAACSETLDTFVAQLARDRIAR